MRAALQALAALGGRHAAHLGGVWAGSRELGDASAAAHAEVAATAVELGVDHLVTVGPTEYGRGRAVADVPAALDLLRAGTGARRRRAGQGVAGRRPGPARRRAGAGAGARRVRGVFIAAGVALAVSILLTPYLIRFFARQGFGQEIRDEGPQSHKAKRGTPTMGGVAIMIAIWVGYLVSHGLTGEPITASAILVLFLTTALGVVGFLDDFIKLRRQRNLGLNKTSKLVGQLVTALVFGILAARFVNAEGLSPGLDEPVLRPRHHGDLVRGRRLRDLRLLRHRRLVQRGQPHRRPRRARRRHRRDGARHLRDHRVLAVPQRLRDQRGGGLLPGARPAGRRAGRRRRHGRLHRIPLVERRAGPHLHGRHRLAGAGRPASPGCPSSPAPSCCSS